LTGADVTYSGERPELLPFLDVRGRSVLDVGCGAGGLAPMLRDGGASRIVGVEPDPAHARAASAHCDAVLTAPIEDAIGGGALGEERFDLILLADVLEHLVDPWSTLRALVSEHLAPGGDAFVSVPNVANLAVVKQLLRHGDWRYEESGMFDRTHLRWFGPGTLRGLLRQAGLEPVVWGGRISVGLGPLRFTRIRTDVSRVPSIAVYQFHVLARARG